MEDRTHAFDVAVTHAIGAVCSLEDTAETLDRRRRLGCMVRQKMGFRSVTVYETTSLHGSTDSRLG